MVLLAKDGLPARDSGPWAKEKLYYLRRYIYVFNTGMKNRWAERAYVDLMSGSGRCVVAETGEEFEGSPLIALNSETPFTQVVLVEADEELCRALERRTGGSRPDPVILCKDANDSTAIKEIRAAIPPTALTLVFVDLLGMDIAFKTLADLTSLRKMDLVITFPEQDIARNVAHARAGQQAARWDTFFGTGVWREVIAKAERRELQAASVQHALRDFYGERLGTLGYEVSVLNEPMRNRMNAPLYRPLYATKHPRGTDFWKKISAIGPQGEQRLF